MPPRAEAFLDTSALFAGLWSAEGGARMILELGEAGAVRLLVDSAVLEEIDRTVRRKAPDLLGLLAVLLDRCRIEVVPAPATQVVERSLILTGHPGDARVVAAAWQAEVDYFVTLDRAHILNNSRLREAVPFPLGTPGDFLAWFRAQVS